jgi:hypothetical protein
MAETGTVFSLRIQCKTSSRLLIRIPLLYKSLLNPEQNISNSTWVIYVKKCKKGNILHVMRHDMISD